MHIVRPQRSGRRDTFDLGNDEPAMIAHGSGLVEGSEGRSFMLEGQVAPFVRSGAADNRHIGHDVGKMQPGVAGHLMPMDNWICRRVDIHGAAFALRIDKCAEPHLGKHTGPAGRHIAVHIEKDAGRHVIGLDPVLDDHPPDVRHRHAGRTTWIGAGDHPRQQTVAGNVVHALDAVHVAGGDGMQGRQPLGMTLCRKTIAKRFQHLVGTAEARRGGYSDDGAVLDASDRLGSRYDLAGHVTRPCSRRQRDGR